MWCRFGVFSLMLLLVQTTSIQMVRKETCIKCESSHLVEEATEISLSAQRVRVAG